MARRSSPNIEQRWYDAFGSWPKADREAALRTLGILHRTLLGKEESAQDGALPAAADGTGE